MGDNFESGMALALWLETTVRPQLRKWGRSGDQRVRHMAGMLSTMIEDAFDASDWAFLRKMHETWLDHQAEAAKDAG